jgi:hypothetical protein
VIFEFDLGVHAVSRFKNVPPRLHDGTASVLPGYTH